MNGRPPRLRPLRTALVVLVALACSGCMTFGRGMMKTRQNVTFVTVPEGVQVEVGAESCETPCALPLTPNHDHTAVFRSEGYQTELYRMESRAGARGVLMSLVANTAVWGWWTCGIGTAAGLLVDVFSGATRALDLPEDDSVRVTLLPVGAVEDAAPLPGVATAPPPTPDPIDAPEPRTRDAQEKQLEMSVDPDTP